MGVEPVGALIRAEHESRLSGVPGRIGPELDRNLVGRNDRAEIGDHDVLGAIKGEGIAQGRLRSRARNQDERKGGEERPKPRQITMKNYSPN
jgi:hypothetical protein